MTQLTEAVEMKLPTKPGFYFEMPAKQLVKFDGEKWWATYRLGWSSIIWTGPVTLFGPLPEDEGAAQQASAYLAQCAADGEVLVTEEWMQSICHGSQPGLWYEFADDTGRRSVVIHVSDEDAWPVIHDLITEDEIELVSVRTRSDVRQLLAAMKIKTTPPPTDEGVNL